MHAKASDGFGGVLRYHLLRAISIMLVFGEAFHLTVFIYHLQSSNLSGESLDRVTKFEP